MAGVQNNRLLHQLCPQHLLRLLQRNLYQRGTEPRPNRAGAKLAKLAQGLRGTLSLPLP